MDIEVKRKFNPSHKLTTSSHTWPGSLSKAYQQILRRANEAFAHGSTVYYAAVTDLANIVFWKILAKKTMETYYYGPCAFGGQYDGISIILHYSDSLRGRKLNIP